jgi:AcrR family transcriptional regulator
MDNMMRDGTIRRMTRRDMRREATRANVIEAARKVFLSEGYEGATIKMIADSAKVSPGTVLNAAPSKAALLIQILGDEYEAIRDAGDRLEASLSGSVLDRLAGLLQVSLEAQSRHGELFAAAIGHSWRWTDPVYQETFEQISDAWEPVARVVKDGVKSGELRAGLDVDAVTSVLEDVYLGVLRRVRREELDQAAASALMRERIALVLDGLKA